MGFFSFGGLLGFGSIYLGVLKGGSGKFNKDDDVNFYVGYLFSIVDDEGLVCLFVFFGVVEYVKVIRDCFIGVIKGYGFVKFFDFLFVIVVVIYWNGY